MAGKKKKSSSLKYAYVIVVLVMLFSISTRWISGGHDELYSGKPFSIEVL